MIRTTLLVFLSVAIGGAALLTFYFEGMLNLLSDKQAQIQNIEWNVALIALGIIASASKQFYYLPIKLKKQTSQEMFYQLAGVIPNIILNFILIPPFGLLGASIATFISYMVIIVILNYNHSLAIDKKFIIHLTSFFGLAAIIGVIEFMVPGDQENIFLFITSAGTGTLIYVLTLYFSKKIVFVETMDAFKKFRKLTYSRQSP